MAILASRLVAPDPPWHRGMAALLIVCLSLISARPDVHLITAVIWTLVVVCAHIWTLDMANWTLFVRDMTVLAIKPRPLLDRLTWAQQSPLDPALSDVSTREWPFTRIIFWAHVQLCQ